MTEQSVPLGAAPVTGSYSHPELPARHSYPLAIRYAGFAASFGLLMRTLPYAIVRFGILVAFSIATILWFCITIGGGVWLGARVAEVLGWVWAIGGLCLYGYIWVTILRYALHVIECGHVAVLTELIVRGSVGNGSEGMFAYGRRIVKERFAEVTILFGISALVQGVVRAFHRTLDFIDQLIPLPGLDAVVRIVTMILTAATRYLDKTIFSYNLARGDANPWRSSHDGLIYYAMNAKEVLKTAVWIVVLDKLLTFIAWLVMLAPAALVAVMLPSSVKNLGTIVYLLIAALFAANIRSAFIKPLFLIMIMTKFHTLIQGQAINETWDARLTEVSNKFVEIKNKAAAWVRSPPARTA